MMTKCKPSLNIHDEPHDVWVCIKKDTGMIHSAYCNCFAAWVILTGHDYDNYNNNNNDNTNCKWWEL